MSATINSVEYFHLTVRDEPGRAYSLLSRLAKAGVDLLAFSATPIGPQSAYLVLFPREPERLQRAAGQDGLALVGPEKAFLVQGDDELGALVDIHRLLADRGVNVYASSGVADGRGGFGYVLYVRAEDHAEALQALGL